MANKVQQIIKLYRELNDDERAEVMASLKEIGDSCYTAILNNDMQTVYHQPPKREFDVSHPLRIKCKITTPFGVFEGVGVNKKSASEMASKQAIQKFPIKQ